MEVSDQLHAPAFLLPGKERPVPVRFEAGWAAEPVWKRWRREENGPCREFDTGRPARSLVTILTELSRFLVEWDGRLL